MSSKQFNKFKNPSAKPAVADQLVLKSEVSSFQKYTVDSCALIATTMPTVYNNYGESQESIVQYLNRPTVKNKKINQS